MKPFPHISVFRRDPEANDPTGIALAAEKRRKDEALDEAGVDISFNINLKST